MENSENKNSTRAILLGVIFVFLGFLCAFILFKFFTGPKHVPVSNLIAAIEQKKTNVPEAQPLVVEQTIVEEKQDSESVEQAEDSGEKVEERAEVKVEEPIDRVMPELVLNGIFASEAGSYALINNRIVREGETISGAKVVRIYANKVELNAFGKEIILRVQQ